MLYSTFYPPRARYSYLNKVEKHFMKANPSQIPYLAEFNLSLPDGQKFNYRLIFIVVPFNSTE